MISQRNGGWRGVKRWLAVALVVVALAPLAAPARAAAPEPGTAAALQRSSLKALTYKIMTTTTNLVVFSAATRSVTSGAGLTAVITAYSFALYTFNDFAWDALSPPAVPKKGEPLDLVESGKRATLKLITYKSVSIPSALGIIYLWTRSARTALTWGGAAAVLKLGLFYVNNIAWDYYDWWQAETASR